MVINEFNFKCMVLKQDICIFLRFGGTVPTQNNLLLKYSKIKIIGIIIHNYIATVFFFSFDVSVSLQLLSPDQDLKGKGYGFGIWDQGSLGFLQGLIGFILDFGGFQDRFSGVGLTTVCFQGSVPEGQTFHWYPEHRNIL